MTKVSWILPFPAQVGSLGGSLIMGLSPLVGEKSYLNVVLRISVEQFLQIFLGKRLGLLRDRNKCFGELQSCRGPSDLLAREIS